MKAPDFWQRPAGFWAHLLTPLGWIYACATARRLKQPPLYESRARVVSIGNLHAGGVGKTPVVLHLAHLLAEEGLQPVILSRGYGGRLAGPVRVDPASHTAQDVGDEPLMMAQHHPVVVAENRGQGGALIDLAFDPENVVILMDDAHQNPQLKKHFSLVVIDGETGWGNGKTLPVGPLREPVSKGLRRADALICIGGDQTGCTESLSLPVSIAYPKLDLGALPSPESGQRLFAFAGIGRPEKFFTRLHQALPQADIVSKAFPDHHPYSAADIAWLYRQAKPEKRLLVTTEKDYIRLNPVAQELVTPVHLSLDWDASSLIALIRQLPR